MKWNKENEWSRYLATKPEENTKRRQKNGQDDIYEGSSCHISFSFFVGKKSKWKLVTDDDDDDDDDDDPITKLMWCVVVCDRRKCKEKEVNI